MDGNSNDLVSAQQAYQDAVEKRRRVDEVRPPELPGPEGGESSAMETWRARKAEAEADVAAARRRLDDIVGTTQEGSAS
jgi:hypothetical protein